MTQTDDELLELARKGDQRAFRLLVERHEGRVAATVIGMLGHGPEAEDVGQEVFVRLFRSIDKFRGDSSLDTYLTRIAINQSIKALKRRRSWSQRFLPWDRPAVNEIADYSEAADFERSQLVDRALGQLNPEHRAVAVLRLMEGFSTREAAEILGVPEGTVMSRLSRALTKLRSVLEPEMDSTRQVTQ